MDLFKRIEKGTYIIAEMSGNHSGKLEDAKNIIYAAKESGADCIKIQTYTADTLTIDCDKKYFQIKDGTWNGENLYSLYQKAYTPWEWQNELKEEAEKVGLDFLSTPFDNSSVDFLEQLGLEFYKIASFELIDLPLIRYVASKGKPIILSTGMGAVNEIQEALDTIQEYHNQVVLLKCSSAYPAITKEMNLKTITHMRDFFHLPVGLSDHSMGSVGAVVAVALGAKVIEKHFCLSRAKKGPDSTFSMEPKEFAEMVQQVRLAECAVGNICYEVSESEKENLKFRRSIFVTENIEAGEYITEKNIRIIRPGYGLKPKYYDELIGKKTSRKVERGTPFSFDMIESDEK